MAARIKWDISLFLTNFNQFQPVFTGNGTDASAYKLSLMHIRVDLSFVCVRRVTECINYKISQSYGRSSDGQCHFLLLLGEGSHFELLRTRTCSRHKKCVNTVL